MDKFIESNIELKLKFLQKEHEEILEILYNNSIESGCVKDYETVEGLSQCMEYTEIKKKTSIDPKIVLICLSDLENLGFIIKVKSGPLEEWGYGISWLGLKRIELVQCRESSGE